MGNVYSKISFEYDNKRFSLFSKVEYINFNGEENKDNHYLQPVFGYVPFLKNGKIYIAYSVKYIKTESHGKLEFRLRSNRPFINFVLKPERFISRMIFSLMKILTLPIKVSEFDELVSLSKSELEFYKISS